MVEFLVAWVLVMYPGSKESMVIPGIATEQACNELADTLFPRYWMSNRRDHIRCLPYKIAPLAQR